MSAAFRCRLGEYNASTAVQKLGALIAAAARTGFPTHQTKQTEAWQVELRMLERFAAEAIRRIPNGREWSLLFEFEIPRRGKRPDVILLADDLIFVIEFKVGAAQFLSGDEWQALSYALDLRDFHLGSQGRTIIPVLVATAAQSETFSDAFIAFATGCPVARVQRAADGDGDSTAALVCQCYGAWHDPSRDAIDAHDWEDAAYRPAPSIIEAAETLFSGHGVADISHAFASNLDVTCRELLRGIESAQRQGRRVICFVTGVPGAGKTLAGLNAVHDPSMRAQGRPAAVFLSGNGPLVRIVRAALIRDRQRAGISANEAGRTVATFIDNVHRFITAYGIRKTDEAPYENVIVFDEAQRAWDAAAVGRKHRTQLSEPELVLDIMERAPAWCTIIALVGGGQEIYRGEAGLEEWGRALNGRRTPWAVHASPAVLSGGDVVAGHRLFSGEIRGHLEVFPSDALHLDVSVRSPRARRVSEWVNSLLVGDCRRAVLEKFGGGEFPVVMTRQLEEARRWLRARSEGVQRCGLLASSGALRLRADGIEVSSAFRHGYSYEDWFLAGIEDPRSSMWLEVAATEFECQGLELDWTGVCWGGDFVISPKDRRWVCRNFRGAKWQAVRSALDVGYLRNKYRVLLTRARRGMVIWVPQGSSSDPTRERYLFDATAEYLMSLNVPMLS